LRPDSKGSTHWGALNSSNLNAAFVLAGSAPGISSGGSAVEGASVRSWSVSVLAFIFAIIISPAQGWPVNLNGSWQHGYGTYSVFGNHTTHTYYRWNVMGQGWSDSNNQRTCTAFGHFPMWGHRTASFPATGPATTLMRTGLITTGQGWFLMDTDGGNRCVLIQLQYRTVVRLRSVHRLTNVSTDRPVRNLHG